MRISGANLAESLSAHETFAPLIDWLRSGGTGKPAVVYKGRAVSCPSGFFMSRRVLPIGVSMPENYSETTQVMESR
jgi:hypothetical protein